MTVVVADDQPIVRDGFAAVLRAQPDIVVSGLASDGRELVALVDSGPPPDVALVDIRMPVLDGIAAAARISHRTRVVMLTTFDLDDYVASALRAGACGFLLKDVGADRLVEAVRLVASGSMLLGPGVSRRLMHEVTASRATQPRDLASRGLTRREQEVFALLAKGRSNGEIAEALVVSTETVKSHVSEVLRKVGARDRVQLVVLAHEEGLVAPD